MILPMFLQHNFANLMNVFSNTILPILHHHHFALHTFTIMILLMSPNMIFPILRKLHQHDFTFITPTCFCQQNVHHRDFALYYHHNYGLTGNNGGYLAKDFG